MKEKFYLALVDSDFEFTDEVAKYFEEQEVTITKHLVTLGILELRSGKNLKANDLEYISYIEQVKEMYLAEEE